LEKEINEKMRRAGKVISSNPIQPHPPSILALDAGYSNNSFAVSVHNLHTYDSGGNKVTDVHVPVLVEIQTRLNVVLHYKGIYTGIIKPLIERFNVHFVFADRWNSIALLDLCAEDFQARNLVAKQYSVKYIDFQTARSYVEERKMVLPKIEMDYDKIRSVDSYPSYFEGKPAAHLLFQMGTVRDVGSTVIKGGIYTDDLFRALVLGNSRILDPKIQEELALRSAVQTRGPMLGAYSVGRTATMFGAGRGPMNAKHTYMAGYTGGFAPHQAGNTASPRMTSNVVRATRLG
jgi:hypothetical protein